MVAQGPMAKLIEAIRFFEQRTRDPRWSATKLNNDPWLILHDQDGEQRMTLVVHSYRTHESHGLAWAQETFQALEHIATILNTAIDMASLASTVKTLETHLEQAREDSEGWIRSGQEYAQAAQALMAEKDDEIDRLRHAVVYGLEAVAVCPVCKADRANGEMHDETCALLPMMQE